jgi:ribosomal protein S14
MAVVRHSKLAGAMWRWVMMIYSASEFERQFSGLNPADFPRVAKREGFRMPARALPVDPVKEPASESLPRKQKPSRIIERRAGAGLPNRIPQRVDLCRQQIRPAVEQVRSEEECPTRNAIATMIRHDGSVPGSGERRAAPRVKPAG